MGALRKLRVKYKLPPPKDEAKGEQQVPREARDRQTTAHSPACSGQAEIAVPREGRPPPFEAPLEARDKQGKQSAAAT